MLCNACGFEMCYVHQRPWHKGLTCHQFDIQTARRLRDEEAAVRAVIQRTTRPCPNCRVNVEKVEGTCNHMTCEFAQENFCGYGEMLMEAFWTGRAPVGCGHESCYDCLVKWMGYGRRTTHIRTCSSYIAS